MKPPSPLVGFNNNVKHKGRIFHVQTEDSGVNRPRITTHLFADGGRIVKTSRTDYSEHLGRADMSTIVRRLMKDQHKAMFIALRDGQLDESIDRICGPSPQAPAPATGRFSLPPMSAVPVSVVAGNPEMPAVAEPIEEVEPPPPSQVLVPRRPAPTLTDLVLADLEAAKARGVAPPPKPARGASTAGAPASPSTKGARAPGSRYAAPRPAAIFSPGESQGSIFGGGSISEKSLDEVILSYLAEDLDAGADK